MELKIKDGKIYKVENGKLIDLTKEELEQAQLAIFRSAVIGPGTGGTPNP